MKNSGGGEKEKSNEEIIICWVKAVIIKYLLSFVVFFFTKFSWL